MDGRVRTVRHVAYTAPQSGRADGLIQHMQIGMQALLSHFLFGLFSWLANGSLVTRMAF